VFVRRGEILVRVRQVVSYVSPRLGIRFDLSGPELVVYGPDGSRFLTFEELPCRVGARLAEPVGYCFRHDPKRVKLRTQE
jgi:hypothetical protein